MDVKTSKPYFSLIIGTSKHSERKAVNEQAKRLGINLQPRCATREEAQKLAEAATERLGHAIFATETLDVLF